MDDELAETSAVSDDAAWRLHLDTTPVPYCMDEDLATVSIDVLTDDGNDGSWGYTTPSMNRRHHIDSPCSAKANDTTIGLPATSEFASTPATASLLAPVQSLPLQQAIESFARKRNPQQKHCSTTARVAHLEKALVKEKRRQRQIAHDMHEKFKNLEDLLDQCATPCSVEPMAPTDAAAPGPPPPAATTTQMSSAAPSLSGPEQPSLVQTRVSSPSQLVVPSAFQVGDKLECYSISQNRWSNAFVRAVRNLIFIVEYEQKDAKGSHMLKKMPLGHHHLRHTNTSIATLVLDLPGVS